MCEPATIAMISTAATIGSTVMGVSSAYQQSQNAKRTAQNNANLAELQAKDAQRKGEETAQAIQRRGAALKSSQRVALAANGLDLGYGTAADLQDQTDFFTMSDTATARSNAGEDAWSKRAQGANYQGQANAQNPMMMAGGSLLTGAGQVAEKWDAYRKAR